MAIYKMINELPDVKICVWGIIAIVLNYFIYDCARWTLGCVHDASGGKGAFHNLLYVHNQTVVDQTYNVHEEEVFDLFMRISWDFIVKILDQIERIY